MENVALTEEEIITYAKKIGLNANNTKTAIENGSSKEDMEDMSYNEYIEHTAKMKKAMGY